MRVLVTGATGFLGGNLARRLTSRGIRVTGLGRNLVAGAALEKDGVRFIPMDMMDRKSLIECAKNHSFIVHCAALSAPWGDYNQFYRANVTATENVIAASRSVGVQRVIHISTPSIYIGDSDRFEISEDEELPQEQVNDYARTKLMAEQCIDQAFKEGLPVVTIRPQGIVGPGDRTILPRLIRAAKKRALPVIGDGKNIVDITYVDNVSDAITACLEASDTVLGKKYNITNGQPMRNYDLIRHVLGLLGISYRETNLSVAQALRLAGLMEFGCRHIFKNVEPPLTRYAVLALSQSRTLSIENAKRDLGYQPRIELFDGLNRFATWWKTNNEGDYR